MAVSLDLHRSGIPHVVVGGAPDGRPRLGESLNLEGTLLLDQFCGDYHHWMGPKMGAAAYMGEHVVHCGFDVAGKKVSVYFYKVLGTEAPSEFHHIDRIGMDTEMYERMLGQSSTTVIDAKIESVGFDAATDRVREVVLSTGDTLSPSIVFDCTNHKRVVAQAAGVNAELLSAPQRVVYTHYHPRAGEGVPSPRPAYDLSTNQVRLFKEIDGIDAVAWYIPLPTYLSIGVSMTADSNDLSDDEVLACVARSYANRGMDYSERYPERAEVMTLHHRYFVHERAAGANWILAGQTYASTWWMAGAGVGTSFVAGRMATDFVRDPATVGPKYHNLLKNLLPIHHVFEWMASAKLEEVNPESIGTFSDRFIRTNVIRLAKSAQIKPSAVTRAAGQLLEVLVNKELVLNDFCDVYTEPLAVQTEKIFGPEAGTPAADDAAALVLRLADVISGREPVAAVDDVLATGVVAHLDGLKVRGTKTWRTWLGFLRSQPGMSDLELVDTRTAMEADGTIALHGKWRAGGRESDEVSAWYKVRDGRIVEIWTKSANYTFMLGPVMNTPAGKLVASARAGWWSRQQRRSR